MEQEFPAQRAVTPWHLWVTGVILLLWNAIGTVDFTATLTRFEPYLASFPQAVKEQIFALPWWMFLVWGVGVWGGFVGTIFLLLRKRWAVPLLAASTAGAVGSLINGLIRPIPGATDTVFASVIVAIAGAALWYAMRMAAKRVLV